MIYLRNRERTIFLHFLNREASEAGGRVRDAATDLKMIDILTISHCSKMTVNISQMLEYIIDKEHLVGPLSDLCKAGIILTTSNNQDFDEFIASRQRMYESDFERYPIYFEDTSVAENFSISQKNNFSMTRVLRRDIFDVSERDLIEPELDLSQKHAHSGDWKIFVSNIDPIQKTFGSHPDAAITKGNLEHFSNVGEFSPRELAAIARVVSARYFDHYKKHSLSVTCTGIGDVGFLEDFILFPHYDIPVLAAVLDALSWRAFKMAQPDLRDQVYASYGNRSHINFVAHFQSFVGACYDVAESQDYPKDQPGKGGVDFVMTLREHVINTCKSFLYSVEGGQRSDFRGIEDFYDRSAEVIFRAIDRNSRHSTILAASWRKLMSMSDSSKVLIVTATDTEDDAVVDALRNAGFASAGNIKTNAGLCPRYTSQHSKEIILARSSAGSVGSSGSELVVADAILSLKPDYVIAVGICFGLKPDKATQKKLGRTEIDKGSQCFGDVIYSEKVTDYETVRLTFENNEEDIRERGARVPASSVLLDAARIVRGNYRTGKTKVHPGELISGLKLLDSRPAVDELKCRFPDAVGGEMEASGLVAASSRHGIEWIVVKAICDWGYSKEKKEQKQAADNAAGFAMSIVTIVQEAKTSE